MRPMARVVRPFARGALIAAAMLVLAACPKQDAKAPAGEPDLRAAAQQISRDLGRQLKLPADARTVVIDPVVDRVTGQQTGASAAFETALTEALPASVSNLTLIDFTGTEVNRARLVIAGTTTMTSPPDRFSVTVSLSDRESGLVVAQAAARFRQAGLDSAPTAFYADSPSVGRDRSMDGYVNTASTPAGQPADALYLEQVPTAAILAEALDKYNAGQYSDALTAYSAAAARTDGQQLRTFNGLYLTNVRLKRAAEAENAFGKIAAFGLATNNLAVKLLFRPNSATEFWPTPELSGMYPMWIRQIARAAVSAGSCLNVVGHTSRSGSEGLNDRLSLSRAEAVKRMLEAEAPALAKRLQASGVGYSQNLIGTGADDASDAVDRRVEFVVVECQRRQTRTVLSGANRWRDHAEPMTTSRP